MVHEAAHIIINILQDEVTPDTLSSAVAQLTITGEEGDQTGDVAMEMIKRNKAPISYTATPNNTPFGE